MNKEFKVLRREEIVYVHRDRQGANDRLIQAYFVGKPFYTNKMFEQRYRIRKNIFLRIVHCFSNHSPF